MGTVTTGHMVGMEISAMSITMVPLLNITGIPTTTAGTVLAMVTITEDIMAMVTITAVIEPDIVKNDNLMGHLQVVVFMTISHICS